MFSYDTYSTPLLRVNLRRTNPPVILRLARRGAPILRIHAKAFRSDSNLKKLPLAYRSPS
jgi:hypothetical protein